MLYCTDYRFYHRIMENSSVFIEKNRDSLNTKHNIFRIPSFTICFFNFLVFLTSFFLFYLSMVFKKIQKFLSCFIVWIRDFIKNLRYLKSQISTKFHRLLFLLYFFSIFDILFSISLTLTCPKIIEFFVLFCWRG